MPLKVREQLIEVCSPMILCMKLGSSGCCFADSQVCLKISDY